MHRACSTYPFGTSVEEMRGAGFADVDVGPECRSPRYHETCS